MHTTQPKSHYLLMIALSLASAGGALAHWHQPLSWTDRTHPPRRPPPRYFVQEPEAEEPRVPWIIRDFEVHYPPARTGKDRKHEDHERPAPEVPLEQQGS